MVNNKIKISYLNKKKKRVVEDFELYQLGKITEEDEETSYLEDFTPRGMLNRRVQQILKNKKLKAEIRSLPVNIIYDKTTKKFIRHRNPNMYEEMKKVAITQFPALAARKITANDWLELPYAGNSFNLESYEEVFDKNPQGAKYISMKVLKNLEREPNRYIFNDTQAINLSSGEFVPKEQLFYKGIQTTNEDYKARGYTRLPMSRLFKVGSVKKEKKGATGLFHQPKKSHHGASIFQQYEYTQTDMPTDIEQFQADILNAYELDFSVEDKTRPNQKVIITFGQPSEFRVFPIDAIQDLAYMIENWKDVNSMGSDTRDFDGESVVALEKLNLDFFRIVLSGTPVGGARGNKEKGTARWWFLNQPKTSNNECLEGAIRKGLEIKDRTSAMRKMMCDLGVGINMGDKIQLSHLKYYEVNFQVNLNIYLDNPHIKDGVEEANLIRESKGIFETTLKILLKDEHYSLIKAPKKCLKMISRPDCRILGYDKDGKKSVLKLLQEANIKEGGQDPKKLNEIGVIFDNETIFDKKDEHFLKVYGVSWFCWDFKIPFNYDDGWNEDKTHNKYNYEPYCYYKNGENCIDELIRFLLNPPQGVIYRPMGFNNSRFDNYSFCESAMKFKVLEDLFLADGSILYTRIRGIKNVWDASRFLVGQSLNSACKSYNTNPKKMPDLINHYEVQCYYELNGWKGLTELLDSKEELVLYNKIDCICLASLIQKMRNAYLDMFQEDVFDNLTISSMGYKICCDKWHGKKDKIRELYNSIGLQEGETLSKDDKNMIETEMKGYKSKHSIYKALNYEDDFFHRRSIVAGRTQSFFGKLDLKMPLAMCDVKSLYPTIMGSYADDCPMPYGKYYKTDKYVPNKLGIYNVDIVHQRAKWKGHNKMMEAFERVNAETGSNLSTIYAPNVIAKRSEDKPLDWFHKGEIKNIVLTSVDIEVLKWATEDNDCIVIKSGHYWKESKMDLFTDFIEPAKAEKTRQDNLKAIGSSEYNPAKREGCKMSLNSLSGKLLEAIHENESKIFNIENYREMEKDEKIQELMIQDFGCGFAVINGKKPARDVFNDTKREKRKPAYLGMFIYSYSRKLMYEKLLSRYLCLYMDTDSACMPLFEWERCCAENATNGLIETGEFGCLEEEVCYTDKKTKEITPANRLIAISPKNYAVLNDEYEFMSKRKFKGVRKTDVWLPLSYFANDEDKENGELGYKKDEKGKLVGSAVDFIRGNKKENILPITQDEIRRMREFGCCKSCVEEVIEKGDACKECEEQSKIMLPAYNTKMFEELVNGRKIVVFCSMINRIKYRMGKKDSNKYIEGLGNELSVEEMEAMCSEAKTGVPMEFTISHRNLEIWKTAKKKFKQENKNYTEEQLKEEFVDYFQRFRKINNERNIEDVFKLKQVYMVKII